ncbi:MAG TPA: molybdopterin-binding protein [Candidatus Sulfotelmatobacter sp.]|nr:molybdopterin-binding protein [Candidatus Sulfotelmatobacter sp.]
MLTRDLVAGEGRWPKGRQLTAADLRAIAAAPDTAGRDTTVLLPDRGELHEDDAARRLARLVGGGGLAARPPRESRVDLIARRDGVAWVDTVLLASLDAIDALEVFTVLDGQVVRAGQLVASVKIAPHLIPGRVLDRAARLTAGRPVARVAGFHRRRVAALVKESLHAPARARFEASVRQKVEALGSTLVGPVYVADEAGPVTAALRDLVDANPPVDLVLTAGGASTDPDDPFYVALAAVGGRVVRHGVPAHPGSMVWLGRAGRTTILGLPTCGAYSRATAADLLLPWLLSGAPPTRATVARLGHGGILTRDMRFRMPAYAHTLDAPEG